jgi:hypothetical protein
MAELKPFPPEPDAMYEPEHPEDKANRLSSSIEAREAIGEFAERHYQELCDLLVTYGDGHAEDKLALLREKFWSATPVGSYGDGKGGPNG